LTQFGAITTYLSAILERLSIAGETWLNLACEFENSFSQWVASEAAIELLA